MVICLQQPHFRSTGPNYSENEPVLWGHLYLAAVYDVYSPFIVLCFGLRKSAQKYKANQINAHLMSIFNANLPLYFYAQTFITLLFFFL